MSTALQLNANQDVSGTLSTASKMVATQAGTTSTGVTTKVGTLTGWGEIFSKGSTAVWPALGAIGAPSGNGWLLDDTSLEAQQILAGNWQWIEKTRISAGTATVTMVVEYFKRSSAGVYTLIVSITLAAQAFTSTTTTYTSAATAGAATNFATGDKLYKHVWYNCTSNSSGSSTATFGLQTCNNVGAGLTGVGQATSPGYIPTAAVASVAPTSLAFADTLGGSNPASQNVSLSNIGGSSSAWTSNIVYGSGSGWLALSPSSSGSLGSGANVTVAFTCTTRSLLPGTYTATVTFTMTTGGSQATVTVSFVVTAQAGYNVLVGGLLVAIYENSYELDDAISSVSTLKSKIRDDSGANHYTKGQPVTVWDSVTNGLVYTGFISAAIEDRVSPNPLITTDMGARDNHYLAEKRTYDGPEFTMTPAGAIFCQLLNILAQEGIVAKYAADRDTTATDFNAGTLTSVVGASNVDDGDLELSLAGVPVSISESTTANFNTGSLTNVVAASNTLAPVATSAIKLVAVCSQPGSNNAYTYMKIWAGSHLVAASESFSYDVFVLPSSPNGMMGIDVLFTDGTNFRDTATTPDAQFVLPHPKNDIGPMGIGQWYHRSFDWGGYSGKTVQSVQVVSEGDDVGTYTGYFKNIQLNASPFTFSLNTVQQISNNGYSSSEVSVVNTYDLVASAFRNTSAGGGYSIDAAKILQSSYVTWTAIEPAGTKFQLKYSIDGGTVFHICTKNQPLPNLPPGSKIAGNSLIFSEQFILDPTVSSDQRPGPEVTPVLSNLQVTVQPSYAATKTDILYEVAVNADWAAGTFTNATNNGGRDMTLLQFIRNYDNGDTSNQTLWSPSAASSADRQAFHINVASGGEARSQLNFAGNVQDGTIEVDVLVDNANARNGVVYRTTNWANAEFTYGYAVEVTPSQIKLFHGSNAGTTTGTQTVISTVSLNVSSGNWHRLKAVFVGTSHKCYLDDILYINATDGTYTAAGGVALRSSNGTGAAYTAFFDNFGVINAGAALTGQWVSAAQSLAGAGTYGTSVVSWRDMSSDPGNTDTLLVETQVDGSTWQTATNGGAIPNLTPGASLAGVNLKVRATLTTTTASTLASIDNIVVRVVSQLNASGNRISPALSLANVGRLGGSVVAWNNVVLATGCTLGIDTRIDTGAWTDQTAQNGLAIAGLNAQPSPTNDSFSSDTHTSYTNTSLAGGSAATWTYDTANSRISSSGGTGGLFIRNVVSSADVDEFIDMDTSDWGGCVWRYQNTSNYYELAVRDGSNPANPNTLQVFKVSGGVRTAIGPSNAAITFPRGSYHRIRVTMLATQITVYFDGSQKIQFTDATISAAGQCGLRSDTSSGVSAARFYQLNIQPLGDDVSAHTVQVRQRLASTNPVASPQVTDFNLCAFGPTIQAGAMIPQTKMFHNYIDKNIDDLAKASNFWSYFDKNKVPYFLPTNGIPAPFIGSSTPGWIDTNGDLVADFQDANITVEDSSDLYRNRAIVDNVLAPVTINEKRVGDGTSTSWTFGNEWAGSPTILVNGVVASVGVKNVDSGKQFYYAVGDNTITEDGSGPVYDSTFLISFSGPGQYLTYSQADNLTEQAALALIDGTSGIVVITEDGTGLTKAQGDALAQARLNQYSVRGRLLKATTRRYGLAPGQLFNIFLPEHGVSDGLFLIRQVSTKLTTEFGVQQGWYTIEAISGPDTGDWTKMYQRN